MIPLGEGPWRLRLGTHTSVSAAVLDDPAMIALGAAQAQAPQRNVAEVAYHLWRRLRDGDFRVAPRTCEGCGLESSCRIPAASAAFTEPGDEPGDGAAPSSSTTNRPPASAASSSTRSAATRRWTPRVAPRPRWSPASPAS